jgi:hypothetical protein
MTKYFAGELGVNNLKLYSASSDRTSPEENFSSIEAPKVTLSESPGREITYRRMEVSSPHHCVSNTSINYLDRINSKLQFGFNIGLCAFFVNMESSIVRTSVVTN